MVRIFVRHAVTDYGKWRRAYDEFDGERAGMGVIAHAVFQEAGNANNVTVTHDFADLASARAFVESARLKEVMTNAGVAEAPAIWFTTPA